jgi:hypothetical protein
MKTILFLLSVFVLLSCASKNTEQILSQEEVDDQLMQKYINGLPDINGKEVIQNTVKKMFLSVKHPLVNKVVYEFDLAYFPDSKIKTIKLNGDAYLNFDYQGNTLKRNSSEGIFTFVLDNNGLAKSGPGQDKIYYKNNFLIASLGSKALRLTYSKDGNLIQQLIGDNKIVYEYTNYPNTIRQEIDDSEGFYFTFRDTYLGRYNSNLLKSAQFSNSMFGKVELAFSYEFDEQNRVKLMQITRPREAGGNIVYDYSFVY